MRYIGDIYRPPSEAYSLLVQVTVGCSHNKCSFCSMYKNKDFRLRNIQEVLEDIEWAKNHYMNVDKVFLCDGDALCLSNNKLMVILNKLNESFPLLKRISLYGRASDVLRKSEEELIQLRDNGLKLVYIGAESGSDLVLKKINKGETREQLIKAVNKLENLGIQTSVTFISGVAGEELFKEHAIETGTMISEMNPSYAGLLTLMLDSSAPIYGQVERGEFKLLSKDKVIEETILILENAKTTKPCVFRSNHASNYISLKGNLPEDNEKMILELKNLDRRVLKEERFRRL